MVAENASRFARDLIVLLTGIRCCAILGAVSQFEKASLVAKLRQARERIRAETGRRPVPVEVIA